MLKLGKKTTGFYMPNPLEGVEIPDWETVRDFAKWWVDNGCPIAPPDETVHLSDDATSFCLIRVGQFQVELYLIHPSPNLPIHGHPDVEVIKMRLDQFSVTDGRLVKESKEKASETLFQGQTHGAGKNFKEHDSLNVGFGLLAFQKWKDGLTPTTVAARWKGSTVGPMQEALIRKHTPEAIVQNGYADTTGAS
jgi:hypothetical protein